MKMRSALALCAAFLLVSCSREAPKQVENAKEPEKPAEPVTGRYAFHQVFLTARTWASDVQGLRVNNLRVSGVPDQPGKSGAWEVTLVSPSQRKARTFTYSVVEEGNLHKGVFAGLEETYAQRGQAIPWNIQALKKDSDEALKVAMEKGKDYTAKHPDVPITFLLEQTPRHPELTWRVLWGTSVSTAGFSVYVGASTGSYLETMR